MATEVKKIPAGDVKVGDLIGQAKKGPFVRVELVEDSKGAVARWITFEGNHRIRPRKTTTLWIQTEAPRFDTAKADEQIATELEAVDLTAAVEAAEQAEAEAEGNGVEGSVDEQPGPLAPKTLWEALIGSGLQGVGPALASKALDDAEIDHEAAPSMEQLQRAKAALEGREKAGLRGRALALWVLTGESAGNGATKQKAQREQAAKAPAKKASGKAPAPVAEGVDLHAALLTDLKAVGIEPEVRWAPSGNYASLMVDGSNIGYVFKQKRSGIRVEPAASMADLKGAAKKGWEPGKRSERFALVGVFATQASIAQAVAGLVAAHEKAQTK